MKMVYLLALTVVALASPPKGLRWIAHRGGVVDGRHAENGPASLEAAVQHGYWMIESDIRETKDGHIITLHDPDFGRFYGDPRKVGELSLAEVKQLRANPGGGSPMTFAELADRCKGRLHLMLDIKEPSHGSAFYQEIERELRRTGMLKSTYFIGLPEAGIYFRGKARVSATFQQLQEAVARGEKVDRLYFLFEWGKTLTEEQVHFSQKHGVPVVPSVNTFHYADYGLDPMTNGAADIQRLIRLGVTEFQMDSVYEPVFR